MVWKNLSFHNYDNWILTQTENNRNGFFQNSDKWYSYSWKVITHKNYEKKVYNSPLFQ